MRTVIENLSVMSQRIVSLILFCAVTVVVANNVRIARKSSNGKEKIIFFGWFNVLLYL